MSGNKRIKYSLHELQIYLQRVVALNFKDPLWVTAEILSISESRGHTYLELIEKDKNEKGVVAQLKAAIWSGNKRLIKQKYGPTASEILQQGTEVSLQVEVRYHTIFGLSLSVTDLDPAHTLGKLEMLRQQCIVRLQKEGIFNLNREKSLGMVLQRVAVISNEGAAGYHDFISQLQQNEYDYTFDVTLFPSAMQGSNLNSELPERIADINERNQFDCVVIIRGGGSRMDLMGYDQYEVASAIAQCKIPVLTGIGHEKDSSVSDMVAHTVLKTPTAAATFLIDTNLKFESALHTSYLDIKDRCRHILTERNRELMMTNERRFLLVRRSIEHHRDRLTDTQKLLKRSIFSFLSVNRESLNHLKEKIHLVNPRSILEMGYSITTINDKKVTGISELKLGDQIITKLLDGTIISEVQKLQN